MGVSSHAQEVSPVLRQDRKTGGNRLKRIFKGLFLVLLVIGLGFVLGSQLIASPQSRDTVVGTVATIGFVLLSLANPLYGLALALITYPATFLMAVVDLGAGIPNLSVDRVVLALVTGLFLLQVLSGSKKLRTLNVWLNIFAIIFVGVYYLTFLDYHWSSSRVLQFLLDKWIFPILIYFLLSNLVTKEQNIDVILNLLIILGVCSAIYMLFEQITGHVWLTWGGPDPTKESFYDNTDLRITRGLYGTTSTYGNLFNLLIPIDLYYFLKARSPGKKIWYLLAFGLMLTGVFFTYKRSVWLGLLIAFLIIQFFYARFRWLFVAIVLVAALGMAASWDQIVSSEVVSERVTGADWETANGRTERWEAGMDYWRQNPLFGSGFRSYEQGRFEQVENLYIHFLASGGLLLIVPFAFMFLIILANSIRVYRQADHNKNIFVDKPLLPIFWGGLVAYLFMAYFGSNVEGHPISNYSLFMIAGALVGSQAPWLIKTSFKNYQEPVEA
jgi:hypothetical protein